MTSGSRPRQDSIAASAFDPDNGWSDDIEEVLESIRHNAAVMSEKHKKLYIYFKGQLKYYKIPVIIISGLNSVIAVGLQPYLEQGLISGSNCLLALLCGIIGSIELFLGIQLSMETELVASKNFYLLSANIYKTVSLDRHRRPNSGEKYLEEVYTEYTKLFENSALIRTKMKDKLSQLPVPGAIKDTDSVSQNGKSSTPRRGRDEYDERTLTSRRRDKYGERTSPLRGRDEYEMTPPRNHKMSSFTPMPSPSHTPSPFNMMDPSTIFERGAASMMDPNTIANLGYQNMISPQQVMSTGNDLLEGRGMMEDMAGVQQAINTAALMASQGGNIAGQVQEKVKEQVVESLQLVKKKHDESVIEQGRKLAQLVAADIAQEAIENVSADKVAVDLEKGVESKPLDAVDLEKGVDPTTEVEIDIEKGVEPSTEDGKKKAGKKG
jgi:hypothetical protein